MLTASGELNASKTHKTRSWAFVAVDGDEHLGTLTVRQGPKADAYRLEEDTSEHPPARTFILQKVSEPETLYAVTIHPAGVRCNCTGFGRWKNCKHSDAIREAIADGAIPDPVPTELPTAQPTPADLAEMERDYGEWVERFGNEESDQEQPEPTPAPIDYAAELLARTPPCLRECV